MSLIDETSSDKIDYSGYIDEQVLSDVIDLILQRIDEMDMEQNGAIDNLIIQVYEYVCSENDKHSRALQSFAFIGCVNLVLNCLSLRDIIEDFLEDYIKDKKIN